MKRLTSVVILLLLCTLSTSLLAADVTGKWTGHMVLGPMGKTIPFVLDLTLDGSALAGTFCFRECDDNDQPIQNAKMNGDAMTFSIVTGASDVPKMDFQGTVNGDTIKFAISGSPADCPTASCQIGDGSATRAK
jgi:hypothetical protein